MKKALILITTMAMLAGCPDNKGSDNSNHHLAYNACVNCGFGSSTFSQNVAAQIPQGTLTLNLIGDANQMNQWSSYQMNPLFLYQGVLAVGGTLHLTQALQLGMCQLPVGSYNIQTLQAGYYNMGTFEVHGVELIGPVRALVTLTQGVIFTNGNGVISGFGATMVGQNGPAMMPYTYPGYPVVGAPGQISTCGDGIGVRF